MLISSGCQQLEPPSSSTITTTYRLLSAARAETCAIRAETEFGASISRPKLRNPACERIHPPILELPSSITTITSPVPHSRTSLICTSTALLRHIDRICCADPVPCLPATTDHSPPRLTCPALPCHPAPHGSYRLQRYSQPAFTHSPPSIRVGQQSPTPLLHQQSNCNHPRSPLPLCPWAVHHHVGLDHEPVISDRPSEAAARLRQHTVAAAPATVLRPHTGLLTHSDPHQQLRCHARQSRSCHPTRPNIDHVRHDDPAIAPSTTSAHSTNSVQCHLLHLLHKHKRRHPEGSAWPVCPTSIHLVPQHRIRLALLLCHLDAKAEGHRMV